MSVLNIDILKEIVEKVPNDFNVEFEDISGNVYQLSDGIIVRVSEKKLVFKEY